MSRSLPARTAPSASPKPAGFGRFTGPILWTLQGWMALFFLAAGYAKLTEDLDLLSLLMGWPEAAGLAVTRSVGGVEAALAAALILGLLSEGRGRIPAVVAAVVLTIYAAALTVWYGLRVDPGLAATNLILAGLGLGILIGHRRTPPPPLIIRRKTAR